MAEDIWPLGVFASIDAGLGVHLNVAQELQVPTIHLHAPSPASRTPEMADAFLSKLDAAGIRLTVVFGGFPGESYADIPTVARTVGLVPAETRSKRLVEMCEIADFAKRLNCSVVGLHLGFVPHDTRSVEYQAIVEITRRLCDHAGANEQNVHLETGQETAESLLQFLADTRCDNLFVNFDPANMVLYGTGEPLQALKMIGEKVRSVHCKDALWSDQPGLTWGREVPLGDGAVDVSAFLKTLQEIGYRGPLTIEREIPQEPQRQREEIGRAVKLLQSLRQKFWM
ncbi:MAG TPA: sugar phosphate isomerase/epimerase family protein [Pirellulaceae bacterium]|nr:sugar phosphate isomerase/epimerase family protein [Pirellulaceae bacterium]